MGKTHVADHETLEEIAAALRIQAGVATLEWDDANGRYTDLSVKAVLARYRDGLAYGVSEPVGNAVELTKLGANAGIANPVPGTIGTPAVDPYVMRGPFTFFRCNGTVDADGSPHVTAVQGDGRFASDGSNGDVWTVRPVLYERQVEGSDAIQKWVSDTQLPGYAPESQAYKPDGGMRPFVLTAAYPGVKGSDGYMHSYGGYPIWNRSVSHDSTTTQCRTASTGYSGLTAGDVHYLETMFDLKYATKHSQSVFSGCTSYDVGCAPAVAETGATRVIVPTSVASQLVVGSRVMLGTAGAAGKAVDRGSSTAYDVFDARRITAITKYDDSNSSVWVEGASFDTLTTMWLQTAPWGTGECDLVEGDGSPTSCTSSREPFVLQGIELMHGAYEVLGNVIVSNDGSTGWVPYVNHDTKSEATSLDTKVYASTGVSLPTDSADSWKYPTHTVTREGLDVPQGTGASQTTGNCDGIYTNKLATTGTRDWQAFGCLGDGGAAGLRCLFASNGPGGAWWSIASRLSANGRSRG